jgi:hypothetical protein
LVWIVRPEKRTAEYRMSNIGCRREGGIASLNLFYKLIEYIHSSLVLRHSSFVVRHWFLVSGYWFLLTAYCLLLTAYWSLGTGYWFGSLGPKNEPQNIECRRMESLRSVFLICKKRKNSLIRHSSIDIRHLSCWSFFFDLTGRFSGQRRRWTLNLEPVNGYAYFSCWHPRGFIELYLN